MKRIIVPFFVVVTLLSSIGTTSFAGTGDDTLTVMTFNIRYGTANDGDDHWEKRKETVVGLLDDYSPDIIGLQEALRFQLDEIQQALPHYAEIGVGRDDGKTAGEYSAILFRPDRFTVTDKETFWFSDTPEAPGSMTWGNSFPHICTWARFVEKSSARSFSVYNVHLDHVSQPSREKSVAALAERILNRGNKDPVIVTGDFNAGEKNHAIAILKGNDDLQFVDTYRVIHPDDTDIGTFHGFKGTRTGEKIDHVFVEPETSVLDAAILYSNVNGRYPSDHFPVIARIVLPAQ